MFDTTIDREAHIDAPVQKVFDFLTDPAKIPLVMPGLVENKNIPELPLKAGSSFHYIYQMYGVILEGEWKVDKVDSPGVYKATTDGDIPSSWHYEMSESDGGTKLKMHLEYQTPESVLAKIKLESMKKLTEREADHYMDNLKTVLEMS